MVMMVTLIADTLCARHWATHRTFSLTAVVALLIAVALRKSDARFHCGARQLSKAACALAVFLMELPSGVSSGSESLAHVFFESAACFSQCNIHYHENWF